MLLIVPTRNRPENVRRFHEYWAANSTGVNIVTVLMADEDDGNDYGYTGWVVERNPRLNAVEKMNLAAARYSKGRAVIGFMGDDVTIETEGWDRIVMDRMAHSKRLTLLVPNDGVNRHSLPSHVFMSAELYRLLGWFAYPGIRHAFTDHVWRDIGSFLRGSGAGEYLHAKDILMRHRHPWYDPSVERDPVYQDAYAPEGVCRDKAAYREYREKQFNADMTRLRRGA